MSIESDKMMLRTLWTWFTLTCVHCARVAWYLGIVLLVLLAVALTVFRYWLPALGERKAEVEQFLSAQLDQQVRIEQMAAEWTGLYPSLSATGLVMLTPEGDIDQRVKLDELRLDLDIIPLLQGRLVFNEITLQRPTLHLTRTADGEFYLGDIKAPERRPGGLAFLFRQRDVVIRDGTLVWHDNKLDEAAFTARGVNLVLHNDGSRHRFEGRVELPDAVGQGLQIDLDIDGNPFADDDWSGMFSARVQHLQIETLPGIITEKLTFGKPRGRLSLEITTEWQDGAIANASGDLQGRDLSLPLGDFGNPVTLRMLETSLVLARRGDSWYLQFDNPVIALTGKAWNAGHINASYRADESTLHITHAVLHELRPALDAITSEHKIVQLVKDLYPSGLARDIRLTLFGPLQKPRDARFEMDVSEGAVKSWKFLPAATGLSGHLRVTRNGGLVVARAKKSRVDIDRIYEAPLQVASGHARVSWERGSDEWLVRGERLWLKNRDAEVEAVFETRVPFDPTRQPQLQVSAELVDGDLANAEHYFPVRVMPPTIRQWFEAADFAGRMNHARLFYEGDARGFPLHGAREFEVLANVSDASMNFAQGWPRLAGIEADLVIGRNDLWVKGRASDLNGQQVSDSMVHLANLNESGHQELRVQTRLNGDSSRVVDFLRDGPLFRGAALAKLGLAGRGQGSMSLDLLLPLANMQQARVKGRYQALGTALRLPNQTWLEDARGELDFTERSVSASALSGRYLGGAVAVDIETLRAGQPPLVEIRARGEAHAEHLGPVVGDWIAAELSGKTAWQGTVQLGGEVPTLQVKSNLAGLESRFPAPLAKDAVSIADLQVDARFLAKRSEVDVSVSGLLSGSLFFDQDRSNGELSGGCLLIGTRSNSCKARRGLAVAVEQGRFDVDPWQNYLSRQEDDGEGLPPVLSRLSLASQQVMVSGVNLQDVALGLDRGENEYWRGNIEGSLVRGNIGMRWNRAERRVDLRLQRLVWNEAEEPLPDSRTTMQPKRFPVLDVVVDNLRFHNMQLGHMIMKGEPVADGWELQGLSLKRPEMTVTAAGLWRLRADGRHRSRFDVDFTSSDMQSTVTAMDFDIEVDSQQFRTSGYLSWPAAPFEYDLGILDGLLEIHSEKGRFASVEVGAGRLLGVFNVEALRRRLLLDFSDLHEQGFAFDTIDGEMSIKQGVARLSSLVISGPSATIRLQGKLGLKSEDIDMKMAISPAVGGNLAVAGYVFGGPAGAVVTYLAQKAIKEQMNKDANYRYHISGSWDDPVVDKLKQEPAQSAETPLIYRD